MVATSSPNTCDHRRPLPTRGAATRAAIDSFAVPVVVRGAERRVARCPSAPPVPAARIIIAASSAAERGASQRRKLVVSCARTVSAESRIVSQAVGGRNDTTSSGRNTGATTCASCASTAPPLPGSADVDADVDAVAPSPHAMRCATAPDRSATTSGTGRARSDTVLAGTLAPGGTDRRPVNATIHCGVASAGAVRSVKALGTDGGACTGHSKKQRPKRS